MEIGLWHCVWACACSFLQSLPEGADLQYRSQSISICSRSGDLTRRSVIILIDHLLPCNVAAVKTVLHLRSSWWSKGLSPSNRSCHFLFCSANIDMLELPASMMTAEWFKHRCNVAFLSYYFSTLTNHLWDIIQMNPVGIFHSSLNRQGFYAELQGVL